MANGIYAKARQKFLDGDLDWSADNIKAVLCSSSYVVNLSTDEFLSTIDAGWRIATSANLSSKSSTNGVASAANVTFSAVAGGSTVTSIVLYKDTGVAATSPLILYLDTAYNLPYITSGTDITIVWDVGSYKIFQL